MDNILAKRHIATLADFGCSSVLLGFDYDGTLAPVVSTPSRARMRASTRRLLARVAHVYPSVVISGRAHHDLARRLAGVPLWHVFGNHGLEPWARSEGSAIQVRRWVELLRERLATHPGLVVEDKKYSATIHYRGARDRRRVRRAIADVVKELPGARVLRGPQAINLIVRGGPNKGVALQAARRGLACDTAICVGDDETDEDAFTSAPRRQLLAIRVGSARSSRARYQLRAQGDVDRLLQTLLSLRVSPSAPADNRRRAR
jgi:trehalose 6-phosphate phosphatase